MAVDQPDEPLRRAADVGADHTVAMGPDAAAAIRDPSGGGGAEVVLDFLGANERLALGATVTVPPGHLAIVGLAGDGLPASFMGLGDEVPVARAGPVGPVDCRPDGTDVSGPARLHWPAGSLATETWSLELTPERTGWSSAGLRVADLGAGGRVEFSTGATEMAVLPLAGSVVVEVGGRRLALAGRSSVFAAVTDWAYLPVDTEVALVSERGCSVALPFAPATRRFDAVAVAAAEVAVEVRGAGSCTRQVTNFMSPDRFDGAERLMCVEVHTPEGNWSSYPPHKHDDSPECPVNNEEIYYFRVGRSGSTEPCADGLAVHRLYTSDRSIDECVVVRDGDLFCVPRGYHGPSIAAPGYPLYYLNVLASPGALRSMAFCDDPVHHWVRERWAGERPDPRCPMTTAAQGRR